MLQSIPAGFGTWLVHASLITVIVLTPISYAVYNMFYVATWVFLPVCVLKQFLNGVQLAAAASALARSDAEEWIQQRKGEEVDVG